MQDKPQRPSPQKKPVILWAVILLLLGGGAAATFFGSREVLKAKASSDWPTTQGKIIESSVKQETHRRKPGQSGHLMEKIYRARISYEYSVDGVTLTGTRIAYWNKRIKIKNDAKIGTGTSNGKRKAQRIVDLTQAHSIVDRYPKGKAVSVYYMPDNPEICMLEPGLALQAFVAPTVGVFMLFIGGVIAWGAIAGDGDKQNKRKQSPAGES